MGLVGSGNTENHYSVKRVDEEVKYNLEHLAKIQRKYAPRELRDHISDYLTLDWEHMPYREKVSALSMLKEYLKIENAFNRLFKEEKK